jgi:hypothetical protein
MEDVVRHITMYENISIFVYWMIFDIIIISYLEDRSIERFIDEQ